MKTSRLVSVHISTNELVDVIKVYRDEGIRYVVFWKYDPEPTVYSPSEFSEKFK